MLIMRLSATVGWFLTKMQAEAFSVYMQAPRSVGLKRQLRQATSCKHGPDFLSTSPLFQRDVNPGIPLYISAKSPSTSMEAPTGAPSGEESSVLDALIEQFMSPKNGNITTAVEEYLDLCDHALLTRLRAKIEGAGAESTAGVALKNVEAEINMAMQRRLASADTNLRHVLDLAPDIKKMEGSIRTLFRKGKVDMAFMVMISMNLQRAKEAEGADNAVMLLTHLSTFIMALQDERLNPEVKLLRTLLRTDCDGVRKSMLQEGLDLPNHDIFLERPPDKEKVQPHLLEVAITDMIEQVEELGQAIDVGLKDSLEGLRVEINDVVKSSRRPGPFRQ